MGADKLLKWDPEQRFILGIHRYGNSAERLEELEVLKQELEDRDDLLVAGECDLKWLQEEGGEMLLYLYHGFPIPGLNPDLIKSGKKLYRMERQGKLILFEEALQEHPDLCYMIHIKHGMGSTEAALERTAELFDQYGNNTNYFMFSNSLRTAETAKETLPDVPVGSVHILTFGNRVSHLPDYETSGAATDHGVIKDIRDIELDYVIARQNEEIDESGVPYMAHAVKTEDELETAMNNEAIGAFIYTSPEEVPDMLHYEVPDRVPDAMVYDSQEELPDDLHYDSPEE